MYNCFLFFIISASSCFAAGGTSPTSTLQLHIVNHPLYGGISNNNSESFESAISISPVATNSSFFIKANGGNNQNIFAGIVTPKGHYEVKLRYKKEVIRLPTNEDGEFETSVAESELADELVVEIQPYITGTKLPKVHVWTLAKVSTRLVYRFQYGVYEGEAILKWAFTNVQGVLSPGKWYKWRVTDVKTGNLIDSDKVEIGKRVPERVECEAKGKKRVEQVLISITENGKDDGDYEYFLKNPELECAICHDEFKSVDEAWKPKGCRNHLMHKDDMEIWFRDHDICPFCREKRPTKELVPANYEEDTELIGRRDKALVDPIGQFTILYPVLSPAHGYSWSDYEFVYELDLSEGTKVQNDDEGIKDQNDGEGTKDQKNELLADTPELIKSASHRTFSLSRFVTGKWSNSKALPSSLGCKNMASCETFEPQKPGKQIIAVEKKPRRKMVGPETATSESHVESWIRSPKSERILTDLIDSYAIWDQHSTSEKGQVSTQTNDESFGLTRSDSLIGRASEFCSRIRHYFLPPLDSMETFNRPFEFETSSSAEPLPRVRSRDLRATVELSSETIDELFGKLLYTALAGIVAVRDRGLLDCTCNFARLDVNALFKRGPSGDDDGAGPSEIDDGSSALVPLPEMSEGVNRDNVINWIALKKLYGVAIRIALISGQNGQNPNNPGGNRGPNHLQMFAAAYKCLDFNGQTFMNIDPRIGHYESNWMDGILEKSFVLASILPTRNGISIEWNQSYLMNKKAFDFVLENFSTELMPREALSLVDQLIAKETSAGDGKNTKKKNKNKKGKSAKTEQKTVPTISDGIVKFLENKLAELWGMGSHACPMVVFCRAMLQKLMDMPQEEARNFWEQQLYGKQKDGSDQKQQYGTLISEAFDRVDEMAEQKCPEMRLKSQDEEWMKTKGFVHYEEMFQIDYESKNVWKDYLTYIYQLPLPNRISSREDKKAIQLAKLDHLIEKMPGQLNNEFALGPLTMYAHGHEKIQNAIKALNSEAKIYAKNIGDYLKKLVEKMRAERNTKNCQIFLSQFTKVWIKMAEIVKFMYERKEKVLENGEVKSKPK